MLAAVSFLSTTLLAQWTKVPPARIPRTADGKPNLSAPAPKAADGNPDLSGIWEPSANKYVRDLAADLKPGDVPFQPWAKAIFDGAGRLDRVRKRIRMRTVCPRAFPRSMRRPLRGRSSRQRGLLVIVYEAFNLWRQVFMDGR